MNLKSIFPRGSNAFFQANHQIDDSVQSTFAKSTTPNALGVKDKGAKESRDRITLSYRIFRVRCQDSDNSFASTKQITDALVLGRLIPGDDPTRIKTIVEQEKVGHKTEERIELKITYP